MKNLIMLLLLYFLYRSVNIDLNMQTIGIVVQAFATVVLVIVTIIYVLKTGEIAEQARKQGEISAMQVEEQRVLKRQKVKILKVLTDLNSTYACSLEELARLTGIHPDEIEGPIITMMTEGLMEINSSGYYVLKRMK